MNENPEYSEEVPDWIQLSSDEIKEKIVELRKAGTPPSQIGMVLRDKEGIPSVKRVIGKKITEILEEQNLAPDIPEDLRSLLGKAKRIRKHLEEHPSDRENRRNFQILQSKIKRLARYYKKEEELSRDWSYRKFVYA